jgi:hypothetical protein
MSTKNLHHLFVVILCAAILTACTKKKDTFDSDSGTSYSTVDNLFKDVGKVINNVADENNLRGKNESSNGIEALCANVTVTPADLTTFPKTVVVNFGNTGCVDQYGVTRKGQFTAVFTDYLHNAGAHVAVTFQNYYVNGVKLEGLYYLANTSTSSSTRSFADTVTNGRATKSDGKVCTWNATRSSVQTGGFGTVVISDDEYTGQGQSRGVGFNGKNFTATSQNVVWKLACRYFVSGIVTIYSGTDPTPLIVDFGNGVCDNKYKASYDIYNVDLIFSY